MRVPLSRAWPLLGCLIFSTAQASEDMLNIRVKVLEGTTIQANLGISGGSGKALPIMMVRQASYPESYVQLNHGLDKSTYEAKLHGRLIASIKPDGRIIMDVELNILDLEPEEEFQKDPKRDLPEIQTSNFSNHALLMAPGKPFTAVVGGKTIEILANIGLPKP